MPRLALLLLATACTPPPFVEAFVDGLRIQRLGDDAAVVDLRLVEEGDRLGVDIETLTGERLEEAQHAPVEVSLEARPEGSDVVLRPQPGAALCRYDDQGSCVPDHEIVLWTDQEGVETEASAAHELELVLDGRLSRFCVMEVWESTVGEPSIVVSLWVGPQ